MSEYKTTAQDPEVSLWVEQAVAGDSESFGRLYDLYVDRIYRHLYYRVGNATQAEDLAAQVFEKAYKAIGRYRTMGRPFFVWLLSIAHNLLVDHYRAQRDSSSIDDVIIPADDSADPVTLAEKSFASATLRQAIKKLKQDQQIVVVMRYIDGLDYADIAAAVNKTEGAVRVVLHRSLIALRKIISADEGGRP
ncbi:MAG: sigma-70 family RNA polymerase sigma factor [Dehalococcoidia bacterium]|nr:sigma-70 family RNA polymerase sigma factor [Dehalococcoidia bacterium]